MKTADKTAKDSPQAPYWRRALAFGIDNLVLWLMGLLLAWLLFDRLLMLGHKGRLVGWTITLVYFLVLDSALGGGQSVGKRLMRLEIVDGQGEHLGLLRSFVRTMLFTAPIFLFSMILPESEEPSPQWGNTLAAYGQTLIVFGMSAVLLYLVIFNRKSRQLLHDLAVGSYVVRTQSASWIEERTAPIHLVVTGFLLLASLVLQFTVFHLMSPDLNKLKPPAIQAMKDQIATMPHVMDIMVMDNTLTIFKTGENKTINILVVRVWFNEKPDNILAKLHEVVALVLPQMDRNEEQLVSVNVRYGYDLGMVSSWFFQAAASHPVKQWRVLLQQGPTAKAGKEAVSDLALPN